MRSGVRRGRKRSAAGARSETGSARRTLRVLSVFSAETPRHTVESIAKRLGLPQSSIYRYLAVLREAGLIEEDERGSVILTPLILRIASAAKVAASVTQLALGTMRRLAEQSGETVIMIKRSGDRAVCIERVESSLPVRMTFEVGTALPLHRGAAPKLLLAHLPVADREAILADLVASHRITKRARRELTGEFDRIRRTGWSESHAEIKYDVYAVAAPIIEDEQVVAALSIVAPNYRVSKTQRAALGRLVRQAAGEISAAAARARL